MKPSYSSLKVFIFIYVGILFTFVLTITISYFIFKRAVFSQITDELSTHLNRIKSDIHYKDGEWDTRKYLSDPFTPHPHGSSGYSAPLYILTNEGFVIERNLPITGLLDSSDFKHLSEFLVPQYVGVSSERWRVLSKFIVAEGKNVGITFVSSYNPQESSLAEVDKTLRETADDINSRIIYTNNEIDISKVDIRDIKYDISFEIVTSYNKVLLNNGRTPSFIDSSYIFDEINRADRIIKDNTSHDEYLIKKSTILDESDEVKGIIIAALPLRSYFLLLNSVMIYSSLVIIPLSGFIGVILYIVLQKHNSDIVSLLSTVQSESDSLRKITFDSKQSLLFIDNKKIPIPYASNQYYLCKTLFSSPRRRWEQDELLEKLGEQIEARNNRKIYDAALAINRKVSLKLIQYGEKTYQLNPRYLTSIHTK